MMKTTDKMGLLATTLSIFVPPADKMFSRKKL